MEVSWIKRSNYQESPYYPPRPNETKLMSQSRKLQLSYKSRGGGCKPKQKMKLLGKNSMNLIASSEKCGTLHRDMTWGYSKLKSETMKKRVT